jgi:hypothetical protein
MAQDAAGRAYVGALIVFLIVVALTAVAFAFRRQVPMPLLWIGGTIVALGAAFGVYLVVLMARQSSSSNDYEAFMRNTREQNRQRESTTNE